MPRLFEPKNILIINALSDETNSAMWVRQAQELLGRHFPTHVTSVNQLEAADQASHLVMEADTLIFLYPVRWMMPPVSFLQWMEQVFQYDTAFVGDLAACDKSPLQGKRFLLATHWQVPTGTAAQASEWFTETTREIALAPLRHVFQQCCLVELPHFVALETDDATQQAWAEHLKSVFAVEDAVAA